MSGLVDEKLDRLHDVLDDIAPVAVAVSGGVDSLTIACAAHRRLGDAAKMFHAVSPAVPPEATERVRRHAADLGWQLQIIDALEFADPNYLRNPVDRCFFCKSSLYGTIARHSDATIVSGTNVDDLADFRPGLKAAAQYRVRHPYVEAQIDKGLVRAIAKRLDLGDTAELPAAPCLSSRIETGIHVTAETLGLVHAVERLVSRRLNPTTVRCRFRRDGLVVEVDETSFARVTDEHDERLEAEIAVLGAARGYRGAIRFAPYRMGSAFVRDR